MNRRESVMRFHFILVFVFLDSVYACPTDRHMSPCRCEEVTDSAKILRVSCENTQVDLVRGPLVHAAQTRKPVHLYLGSTELGVLSPQLLAGLNLKAFTAIRCNLSAVDENAFSDATDTLRWINLSHNNLERVPTGSLNELRSLSYLYLDFNRLKVLHAGSFKGIHSLTVLSLRGNRLKFIHESAFELGSKFIYIYLGRNELTAFPSRPLSKLGVIEQLNAEDNKISSLQPKDFSGMRAAGSVHWLRLYNNRIRHIPPRTFSSLNRLKLLQLNGNSIEFLHPLAFEGIGEALKFLSLADNLLSEVPAAALRDMRVLESLDLAGNRICTVRENDFVPYGRSIKYLYFGNNSLTFLHPLSLVPLQFLKSLDLANNQLNTVPYKTYSLVLDTLVSFDLEGNPLNCDCKIAWLKDLQRLLVTNNLEQCAWPEDYVKVFLFAIPKESLICRNSTVKPPPTRTCEISPVSSSHCADCNLFTVAVQVSFTYFAVIFFSTLFW